MAWSRAQRALLKLACEPIPEGEVCVDQVELGGSPEDTRAHEEADRQVGAVIEHLRRASAREPVRGTRNIVLDAGRFSWAITSLQVQAGTRGRDSLERAWLAVEKLGKERPLCLWLDDARKLPVDDQEALAFMLRYCGLHQGIRLRVVFLTGPVRRFIEERRRKGRAPMVLSYRLLARRLELTKAGLEEREEDAVERHEERRGHAPGANRIANIQGRRLVTA